MLAIEQKPHMLMWWTSQDQAKSAKNLFFLFSIKLWKLLSKVGSMRQLVSHQSAKQCLHSLFGPNWFLMDLYNIYVNIKAVIRRFVEMHIIILYFSPWSKNMIKKGIMGLRKHLFSDNVFILELTP